jgi:phenylalanyl-tRNA synthetase beta chain
LGINQPNRLGGLAYGPAAPEQWGISKRSVDIFDVKGDIEAVLAPRALTTAFAAHPLLHPGRAAEVRIDARPCGWLGELHPRLVKHFDLPRAPVLFELDVLALGNVPLPRPLAISRLPVVRRDFAVVIDETLPAAEVLDALLDSETARVEAIRLFDVYRGPGLPEGKKSLAILVLMQDTERTLTDAECDATVAELLRILHDRFAATLRQQDLR